MRPQLNVLTDELIGEILDEAKRIMSETGMEIRGEKLKQRLLDSGLKTDASGKRVSVYAGRRRCRHRKCAEVVHALQPRRRSIHGDRWQQRPLRAGLQWPEDPGSSHRRNTALATRLTSLSTRAFATVSSTLRTSQRHFQPTRISNPRSLTRGACT